MESVKRFERENRYVVIKLSKCTKAQIERLDATLDNFASAHVTRLQAEVERLKSTCQGFVNLHAKAQAELTKALELLREWLTSNFAGSCPERNDLRCRTDYALANQSAPADKGLGQPVAYGIASQLDRIKNRPEQGHMVYGHANGVYDTPLYAEQPAPVAVVMPERDDHPDEPSFDSARANGWNECLDEVARLNQIKQ